MRIFTCKSTYKYEVEPDFKPAKKLAWYYAIILIVFWAILYFSIVTTQMNRLPDSVNVEDEATHPEAFIGERAERTLWKLTSIGPKVVGSVENEVTAVNLLLDEIAQIQTEANDKFEIEVDVQEATGNYVHWSMINMYQSIQNIVVKISLANSTNVNYLLVNSHFDTVPGSPGAGDAGAMVVVMLEVMRVITKSDGPLEHPIVFLFNGAEENPLQASHAFITQHKWAKNCKALINLDAAGCGGREILFQSGPDHSWLINYYRHVPHPFANTMGEEIFQAGLIPSDTDFRIFRDFGGVPGLDMASIFNGYVYHTAYDRFNVLSRRSLQNTGDNVLSLSKELANAPEMDNTALYKEGHVVFYDYMGWFIVYYTQNTGIIINSIVCAGALVSIAVSIFIMSKFMGLSWSSVLRRFGITIAIQLLSLVVGAGLTLAVAAFMGGIGKSLTWFSETWLLMGLYFCPMFFGMGILAAFYLMKTKQDPLSLGFRIQLFMHAHSIFLVLITIVLTAMSIKSAFMFMIAVFFDTAALIINLVSKLHQKSYWFGATVVACQIMPFLYFTYITTVLYHTMIPMMGRSGSEAQPDLQMAAIAVFTSIMFAGYIIPLLLYFRKTCTIFGCFAGMTILFIIIAVTPAGFPYKAEVAPQRFSMIHAHRILHNADNSSRVNEAGIYIYPQDPRLHTIDEYIKSLGEIHKVSEYCDDEMFCGMPLYNHRWHKAREYSYWIPIEQYPQIPDPYPQLKLISSTELDATSQTRFSFSLTGPDHMTIFISPTNNHKVINWSFNDTMLRENWEPPYFIYFSYGKDGRALEFSIDVEASNDETLDEPSLELGIGGHWIHSDNIRSDSYQTFIDNFPDYAFVKDWAATYESWFF